MTQYINPTLLGIVPPMDLGRGSADLMPPSTPQEFISPFPLKLRTHNNSRPTVDTVGMFGARRSDIYPDLIRLHDGVDLLAPIGTPVFAAQTGRIASVTDGHVRIEHTEGFRFVTAYSEIRNPSLTLYRKDSDGEVIVDGDKKPTIDRVVTGDDMVDQVVRQGERIAEVKDYSSKDDHLHFEIRYPFANPGSKRSESLSVDPTGALYAWEKKMYRNDAGTRHVVPATRIQELNEIVCARMLRFLTVRVTGVNRPIYFPLGHMDDEDKSLVETLRTAFFSCKQVELVWRDSLFFNQLENMYDSDNKIPILTEVHVRAA